MNKKGKAYILRYQNKGEKFLRKILLQATNFEEAFKEAVKIRERAGRSLSTFEQWGVVSRNYPLPKYK